MFQNTFEHSKTVQSIPFFSALSNYSKNLQILNVKYSTAI